MTPADAPARRRWRRPSLALGTALVALGSGALGLIFDLHPEWRPDPRDRLGATIEVYTAEPGVSIDDWLHRVSADDKVFRKRRAEYLDRGYRDPATASGKAVSAILDVPGRLFYVKTTIEGFKHRGVTLRWSMYDWRTKRRLADPDKHDVDAADFSLDAPSDASVALVWTPGIYRAGWYFVRFEAIDEHSNVLAVSDSARFRSDRPPR